MPTRYPVRGQDWSLRGRETPPIQLHINEVAVWYAKIRKDAGDPHFPTRSAQDSDFIWFPIEAPLGWETRSGRNFADDVYPFRRTTDTTGYIYYDHNGTRCAMSRGDLLVLLRGVHHVAFAHIAKAMGGRTGHSITPTPNALSAEYRTACARRSLHVYTPANRRTTASTRVEDRRGEDTPNSARQALASAPPTWLTDPTIADWYNGLHFTLGHELEVIGINPAQSTNVLAGLRVSVSTNNAYRHDQHPDNGGNANAVSLTAWKCIPDGSLPSNSAEVVSPIMYGTNGGADWEGILRNGFDQVRQVMLGLRANGARVNARCGGHMHIGVEGISNHHRARIVEAHPHFQKLFDQFVAQRRRGRQSYCGPRSQYDAEIYAHRFAQGVATGDRPRSEVGGPDRLNLNIAAWIKYGTFEMRQLEGVLNPRRLFAWACLNKAFFEACRHGSQPDNGVWEIGQSVLLAEVRQTPMQMLDAIARVTDMPDAVKELIIGSALGNINQ